MTHGLKIETSDQITTITLDDPGTLNALTPTLAKALADALTSAETSSRVVILTGS